MAWAPPRMAAHSESEDTSQHLPEGVRRGERGGEGRGGTTLHFRKVLAGICAVSALIYRKVV